jgi:hypothetical protein
MKASLSKADITAILLSVLAVAVSYMVAGQVFENMAHLEDEMAYLWEAQAIAGGNIRLPSPPSPESFLVPFVVDHNGFRFGKYPLGWPLVLGVGEFLGIRSLVNPLLAGAAVYLTYLLGKRLLGETVGLLSAGLTLTSPFFLMNSGSLLSHPIGLVLCLGFVYAWFNAFQGDPRGSPGLMTVLAGLSLGFLVLTRPMTAAAVAFPFAFHGLVLWIRGGRNTRIRLAVFATIVLAIGTLHFVWQYALTGDPFLNPYTLWWEYDTIGFGPGVGRRPEGHTINQAWINTRHSLRVGSHDLFGWGAWSWIFLPIGVYVYIRERNWRALLASAIFPSLVVFYMAYWIGSSLFGPRYQYEGLFCLTLTSAAGIAFLAGWPVRTGQEFISRRGWGKVRPLLVTALVAALVAYNLLVYTPLRLDKMRGLYGVARVHTQPFLTEGAQDLTPALVIVHPQKKWIEYGTLLDLQTPYLDTPFIFAYDRGDKAQQVLEDSFPERSIYHYYLDEPTLFYTAPR